MKTTRKRETRKQHEARTLLGMAMGDCLILGVLRQNNASITEKILISKLMPEALKILRGYSKRSLQNASDEFMNGLMWTSAIGAVPKNDKGRSQAASPEAKQK
jgi:hypothetical protein